MRWSIGTVFCATLYVDYNPHTGWRSGAGSVSVFEVGIGIRYFLGIFSRRFGIRYRYFEIHRYSVLVGPIGISDVNFLIFGQLVSVPVQSCTVGLRNIRQFRLVICNSLID